MMPNNAINSDSEKQRAFVAPLFTAGYGERWTLTMCQILFAVTVWSVTLTALAEFAPGVVNHAPTEEERTKGNTIHSETLCKKQRGEWFEGRGYAYCVLPYADAGKICKNSKGCIGHCIAPVTNKPIDHGTCQTNDSTDDCGRPHFENGKVIYFNCD